MNFLSAQVRNEISRQQKLENQKNIRGKNHSVFNAQTWIRRY